MIAGCVLLRGIQLLRWRSQIRFTRQTREWLRPSSGADELALGEEKNESGSALISLDVTTVRLYVPSMSIIRNPRPLAAIRFRGRHSRAMAAVISLAVVLAASIVGSSPARASTWQAWFAKPGAASCPKGDLPVVPTSASSDAFGVVHLAYSSFPTFTSVVPPKGFSAKGESTGLRADLARYGISTAEAQQLDRHPKVEFCASTHLYSELQTQATSASQGKAPSVGSSGIYNHADGSWAGYSVDGGTGFNGVAANWVVQQSNANAPAPNDDATWIGVGGDATDCNTHSNCSLIQEGTDMQSGKGYRMWFEWVCSTCQQSIAPQFGSAYGISFIPSGSNVVRPKDPMAGDIYWYGTSEACFTMVDNNPNRAVGINGCVENPVPFDNKSIEWIDEDGMINSGYYQADFGQTNWSYQSSWDAVDNSESLPQFSASSSTTVVGNIAATSYSLNIVPPCSNSGVVAYPKDISYANGGSSINVWCRGGPPV